MHITAHLDLDLVAVETDDEITLMLELTAPAAPEGQERPHATVQVVLDRSGSMDGPRLGTALVALDRLVSRLDARDRFGLVTFDDHVDVVVPAGELTHKAAVRHAIAAVRTGGMPTLSAGCLRAIQEVRRAGGDDGATLLLLSDGMANVGVSDPAQLEAIAGGAMRAGKVATTTLGLGLGYDEVLLAAIA